MPSGQTHDRITWVCFPFITVSAYVLTQSWRLAAVASISFLFSGLMFGPDLDVHSKQYLRWGLLRIIWLPYQEFVPHRSWLSHGPIVGTIGRTLYLGFWMLMLGGGCCTAWAIAQGYSWDHYFSGVEIFTAWSESLQTGLFVSFCGLEMGAFSHYASDWISSRVKRLKRMF
ncbi:MAG: metal-binding protein [Cyanobacteria bacterium P01_F01_bin.3]